MKQLLNDLYWEISTDMSITERIAYETTITKLEMIKKILNISDVTLR